MRFIFVVLALPPSPPNTSSEGSVSDHDEEYRLQQGNTYLTIGTFLTIVIIYSNVCR